MSVGSTGTENTVKYCDLIIFPKWAVFFVLLSAV